MIAISSDLLECRLHWIKGPSQKTSLLPYLERLLRPELQSSMRVAAKVCFQPFLMILVSVHRRYGPLDYDQVHLRSPSSKHMAAARMITDIAICTSKILDVASCSEVICYKLTLGHNSEVGLWSVAVAFYANKCSCLVVSVASFFWGPVGNALELPKSLLTL